MAVKIPFDNTGNPIKPTFVLATKSGRKLGAIPATSIHIADNFNSYFDLSFKVYKYNDGVKCNRWDDIQDFKLVLVPEWDIWFEIYVELDDTADIVKNVSAKSVGEAELSQINLYDIQINTEEDISRDDYVPTVLYDVLNPEGSLLHRIMGKAPHYTIDKVDSSIARIQRTFTFDGKSIYDAFQEIAQEINCIFIIDSGSRSEDELARITTRIAELENKGTLTPTETDELKNLKAQTGKIKRSIEVRDLEPHCTNQNCDVYRIDDFAETCPECGGLAGTGYGENTSIFVSTDNLADNINYSTDVDSVKNCFKLEAGDDLMTATVVNCNPNGSAYIWYIPDEMKNDMSTELQNALKAYEENYQSYQSKEISISNVSSYNADVVAKYNALKKQDTFDFNNLKSLSSSVKGYPALMTAYYDTVDAKLLLESGLMPSPQISEADKKKPEIQLQAENILNKIDSLLGGGISLIGGLISTASYVSNAIKSFLGSFLKSSFGIEISNSSYNNSKWSGILKIFDRSDNSICSFINIGNVTSDIKANLTWNSIGVTDDASLYRTQLLYKTLNSKADDETDIVTIFDSANFTNELKKYSLKRLESFRDACQACLNVLIEQGINAQSVYDLYTPYYTKLGLINSEIKTRQSDIDTIEAIQDIILTQRDSIQQQLDFQNYVTEYSQDKNLWLELASYRREDTYSNDNYISDGLDNVELFAKAQEFYEVAQKEIIKSATLQHSITATLKNLLVMKEFEPLVQNFEVGNWIRIGANDDVYRLRLLSYEIDFDNLDNIYVEFSDVKKVKNGFSDIESILNQAASMTTSYGSVSRQASQGQKGNKKLDTWVADGLALTQMKIINNAKNQTIVWDDGGLLCRRYNDLTESYEDEQLKIINSTIAFTTDNWRSISTAIGKFLYYDTIESQYKYGYGVNAGALIGELIMGQQLMIRNSGSTFKVTHDGISVLSSINDKNVSFTVNPNSKTDMICLTCGGEKMFGVDSTGKAFFKGDISGASGDFSGSVTVKQGSTIAGWYVGEYTLCQNSLTSKTDNSNYLIYTPYFQVNSNGTINATNGSFTGTITATNSSFSGTLNSATGKFKGELEVGSNFKVTQSGLLTAKGAVLKSDYASFEFSSSSDVKLGWLSSWFSPTIVPVAILSGASYAVSRNVITGANIDSYGNLSVDQYAPGAGLVHCGTVTETSGGYGFSSGDSLKARFGLNSKGEAFIQITPLNDESTAYATFHFTPDGYIKITSNDRSTTL